MERSPLLGIGYASEFFKDLGKFFVLKMRRKNQEKIGDSLDVHSPRSQWGIPSEPYALFTSSFDKTQRTLRVEIIGKGFGLEGGGLESSKVELFRKRLQKAKHFWIGEVATELSGNIKGGSMSLKNYWEYFYLGTKETITLHGVYWLFPTLEQFPNLI